MPRRRSHTRRASSPSTCRPRPLTSSRTTRKSLPRPWCLVSCTRVSLPGRPRSATTALCPASTQVMRGSRRNQRSWRRWKRRVRAHRLLDGLVERRPRLAGGRAARGSRGPGPRWPTGRPAEPPAPRPRRASPPSSCARNAGLDAPVERRRGRAAARPPGCGNGRVDVEARAVRRERPAAADRHLEGAHHPAPVGGLHAGGRHRIEARRARRAAPRCRARPRARHAPRGSGRGSRGRRRRPGGRGRCRRPGRPGARGRRCRPATRRQLAGEARRR